MKNQNMIKFLKVLVGIAMLLYPLFLMTGFLLHFDNISEFFLFKLKYEPNTAESFMNTLTGAESFRLFVLPHLVTYIGLIFLVPTYSYLSYILFRKKPWFAILGFISSTIGTIAMSGVFSIWLSFSALGGLKQDQIAGALPALENLVKMQGAFEIITILSGLSILGLILLSIGLFISRIIPRWSSVLMFLGNIMIVLFMDLDNWMFIGALFMFFGSIPVASRLLMSSHGRNFHDK